MNRIRHSLPGVALATLLAWGGFAHAQDFVIQADPRTGDTWVDTRLHDFNRYGANHPDGFIDEIVALFGAPRPLVREYVVERRWAPADVWYACGIAHHAGRPCIEVIEVWQTDHGQGWGEIAKRMGIKPGSDAFHALKGQVGRSHGKWHDAGPGDKPGHADGPPPHARDKGKDNGKAKAKAKGRDKH